LTLLLRIIRKYTNMVIIQENDLVSFMTTCLSESSVASKEVSDDVHYLNYLHNFGI